MKGKEMIECCKNCEYLVGGDCLFWDADVERISRELGCTKYDDAVRG
jgi:hypothetical protein